MIELAARVIYNILMSKKVESGEGGEPSEEEGSWK